MMCACRIQYTYQERFIGDKELSTCGNPPVIQWTSLCFPPAIVLHCSPALAASLTTRSSSALTHLASLPSTRSASLAHFSTASLSKPGCCPSNMTNFVTTTRVILQKPPKKLVGSNTARRRWSEMGFIVIMNQDFSITGYLGMQICLVIDASLVT